MEHKPLGDMIKLSRGFDLPVSQRVDGKVPVLGATGIVGWHDEAKCIGPGVTIGRSGVIGGATWSESGYWPLNTSMYVDDFQGNDPRFVYYALKNLDFSGYDSGSAQPSLNRNYINSVPFPAPSIEVQSAISCLLGSLDDKAGTDLRVAEKARKLALALVRAESDGRTVPLGVLVEHRRRVVDPQSELSDAVRHFSLPAFDAGQNPAIEPPVDLKSSKFSVSEPVVLFSKLNPSTPRIWVARPSPSIPSFASTEFVVLAPRKISVRLLWLLCAQPEISGELSSLARGTSNSHQRVSPADILASEVIDPDALPPKVVMASDKLLQMADALQSEAQKMIEVRGHLLPRLMDGTLTTHASAGLVSAIV